MSSFESLLHHFSKHIAFMAKSTSTDLVEMLISINSNQIFEAEMLFLFKGNLTNSRRKLQSMEVKRKIINQKLR